MSNTTMTASASTDQYWMQIYQQPLMEDHHAIETFSDSTVMTTNPLPSQTMVMSPTNSYTNNTSDQLTPKGGNVSKPIRRRSRASKRTPTTLLNANTTNFRQLVQQFTGCPSTSLSSSSLSSLGVRKGPITLNFQQGSSKQNIQHDTSSTTTARLMPQFSSTGYNQVSRPFPLKMNQIQVAQQQQNGYNNSYDYVNNNSFGSNSGNMDVSDGLVVDNDFGLHDLSVNAFSNDTFM
ncbi:VQ motif-containing protein 22-like [Vicia villosa]|uniref:VQ motif-containing protein 22-like n=1 Tax=Vicia villosa TaxID=3911 RepID=UPI00273C4CD2|nr:VQ motif-containing protein 22-like [Vicia villosa]